MPCSPSLPVRRSRDIAVSLPHGKNHQAEFNSASLAYSKFSTARVGRTAGAGGTAESGGGGVGGAEGTGVPPGAMLMSPAFGTAEYCTTPDLAKYGMELPP